MIRPQKGFQENALKCEADIAFLGGAAGAGKSFVLELEPTRFLGTPNFQAVIFRRTTPQIRNAGGLLETSKAIYYRCGGTLKEHLLEWTFPAGTTIKFAHLQYPDDVLNWQGSQISMIGFDELTHFEESQFWYMLSRNRTIAKMRPYVRATMNPDATSWVAKFIEWYINQETGAPIAERAGVLRYFIRMSDVMVWGDSKTEVYDQVKDLPAFTEQIKELDLLNIHWSELIRSFTFIPGNIYHNKILLKNDPGYLGNLMALPEDEQNRLLRGNWKRSSDDMEIFNWDAINEIFDNLVPASPDRYVTCDAARFGRDLMVIFTWQGLKVINIIVMYKSEARDIVREIEKERMRYHIPRNRVVVDQDGVGGGTVKIGGYLGFSGGAAPKSKPEIKTRENYDNLKTQCAYALSDRVNTFDVGILLTSENCLVIDEAGTRRYTTKIKISKQGIVDVRDLIKEDLRSFKRAQLGNEGKIKMNTKEEQKVILGGRSPDFGDALLMRMIFELLPRRRNITISR